MTTTKVLASKLTIALVAAAMVASVFAPVAQAQTTEELQAMINDLLAQVASLQGSTEASASSASVCPYTWTRSLTAGAEGADVKTLQQFLNADADTRVAATGAGSTGLETSFFGPATAAAVSKFQVKYRADVLSPANLVNPTGYFGPSTMSKANALCATSASSTDEDTDSEDTDSEDVTLGGEATLDTFEIDEADDTDIEEDTEDAQVAEITVSFADGDASISRLDLAFTDAQGTDSDAWDVYNTISLWVDGDKVAEADASAKGDYLGDEDNGIIRFSGLDLVGLEDEDVVITVAATINDNLSAAEQGTWRVAPETVRYFDADGVASTETSPVTSGTAYAEFDIQVAGFNDEVKVKESSNDPDATTLLLQDNKKETYTAFVFALDTGDSINDVQVNQIIITATSTATSIANYVNDATLVVDGDEVSAQDVTVGTSSITFDFDDGDFVIEAGDVAEVELSVEFDALDAGEEGDFVDFSLAAANVDSEGTDDIVATGAANGETHVLITEGIVVLADGVTTGTDTSGTNDTTGIFTIEFEVTAYENDFYVATSGINFTVSGGSASTSYTLDSTGNEDTTDVFTVNDGSTETFTLTVTVDPTATGLYRVTLDSVEYSTSADGVTGAETRTLSPASDYRTANLNINN